MIEPETTPLSGSFHGAFWTGHTLTSQLCFLKVRLKRKKGRLLVSWEPSSCRGHEADAVGDRGFP